MFVNEVRFIYILKRVIWFTLDNELPEMGRKQWSETYCAKLNRNLSPAIMDMIGSVRSKIYSIRKLIERDGERHEMAKERYKILYLDLPVEDRVSTIQE